MGAEDPATADAEVSQAYQYLLLLDHPLSARWQAAILYDTAVIKAANAADAADSAQRPSG